MYNYPYYNTGLLSRIGSMLKNINIGNILDGTQKTLGVIKEAIPVVSQIKPIISNAKSIMKIMNEKEPTSTPIKEETNKPTFYI